MLKKWIMFSLMLTSLACSSPRGTPEPASETPQGTLPTNGDVKGMWTTECAQEGAVYHVTTLDVSAARVLTKTTNSTGANCEDSPAMELTTDMSYSLSGVSTVASDIANLDLVLNVVSLAALNDQVVASFNSSGFCGFKDWKLNVAKDVTGLTCMSDTNPVKGTRMYSLIKASATEILLGEADASHDGKTPDTRHHVLGTTKYLRL